jgi:gas vesicle protein
MHTRGGVMSDEIARMAGEPLRQPTTRHDIAMLLTGAAVGVSLGMLFAPRRGSEMRKGVGEQWTHAVSATSTGYHKAMDTATDLAHRGRKAYDSSCDVLSHRAQDTWRYLRDVADAVRMKPHRDGEAATVIPSRFAADRPAGARDRVSVSPEGVKAPKTSAISS